MNDFIPTKLISFVFYLSLLALSLLSTSMGELETDYPSETSYQLDNSRQIDNTSLFETGIASYADVLRAGTHDKPGCVGG